MADYKVISQHTTGLRSATFRSFDKAKVHAWSINPDTDGSVIPNLPQEIIDDQESKGWEYDAGSFWFGNRPAVIFVRRAGL